MAHLFNLALAMPHTVGDLRRALEGVPDDTLLQTVGTRDGYDWTFCDRFTVKWCDARWKCPNTVEIMGVATDLGDDLTCVDVRREEGRTPNPPRWLNKHKPVVDAEVLPDAGAARWTTCPNCEMRHLDSYQGEDEDDTSCPACGCDHPR